MEQTQKYIKVLNLGYSGFAPMTISPDFESSYRQVEERLQLLDSLDYDKLLDEAISPGGKVYLEKYKSTGTDFKYSLHFLRDEKILLDAIPTMFKCFKDGADRFRDDGIWTFEQWREYRSALSQIEVGFEDRLKQFAAAYDFDKKVEIPEELNTDKAKRYFERAINIGLMDANYRWLKGLQLMACYAREMSLSLQLGKGANSDGSPRISWKPFETLFNLPVGKLRLNYNDIQKTGQDPSDIWMIEKVFE